MDIQQIRRAMIKYGKAWETQDSKLILECFTEDGIYQESPLAKPHIGHNEIKKFWETTMAETGKEIKFTLGECFVSKDGKTGFAEWECKNIHEGKRHHMIGIMILKMKGPKISYLNEYWNVKEY